MSATAVAPHALQLGPGRGIALARGEGCTLYDTEGKAYIDLVSNYGVNVLGHGHPAVTAAITEQAQTLVSTHQSFASPQRDAFVRTLGALLPAGLTTVTFANSGTEAIEVAMKLARAATGRTRLVACTRGYHGRTFGALSLTAEAAYRDPFAPLLDGVVHIPYGDSDALHAIDSNTAAAVVEPIQGEAGVRVPPPGWLAALRERCTSRGALLVADEVQTGLRTGALLASTAEGVLADIVCLGKGIANGLPMAVTVSTERVGEGMPRGGHGSTFAGSPLVCAAATATLTALAGDSLIARARPLGDAALQHLRELPAGVVREVRGRGLMIGIELRRPATPVIIELQRRGVLVLPAGRTVIRLLPPLTIEDTTLHGALDVVIDVIAG
ncbi:MAG: aspartate aminotransferase family protein [Candidatus Dormibacteria bacterium]